MANEQRRFQQEIANKGLLEQEQLSLGITQPPPPSTDLSALLQLLQNPSSQVPPDPRNVSPFSAADDEPQNYDHPESYINIRNYRSHHRRPRSVDRQLTASNEIGGYPSTTLGPRPYINAILRNPEPRNDLAKIGNWLIQRLAKQLQENIAHLAEPTPRPYTARSTKAPYPTTPKYVHPTEIPQNLVTFSYPESTSKQPESKTRWSVPQAYHPTTKDNNFDWNQVVPNPDTRLKFETTNMPYIVQTPVQYLENTYKSDTSSIPYLSLQNAVTPSTFLVHSTASAETPKIEIQSPTYSILQPSSSTEAYTKRAKVKNLQIIPSLNPNMVFISPYENALDAYKHVYEVDHESNKLPDSTTRLSHTSTPSTVDDGSTVTSLFKNKLNEFKDVELKSRSTEQPATNFQQPNWLLDQLQQSNSSANSQLNGDSSTNVTPIYHDPSGRTAIFVKLPPEEPTSTVGYIFDKTINAKTLYKKENSFSKKNNRSPQIIKSSLVYRTPPGKRASVSRLEVIQNNQVDSNVVSNFLEPGKPVQWLLGNSRSTTTNRPFVTALWNLIQNRSPT